VIQVLYPLYLLGVISIVDVDPTKSTQENRTLKTMPASVVFLLSVEYTRDVKLIYADTFHFVRALPGEQRGQGL
jgi:hypothetical protein